MFRHGAHHENIESASGASVRPTSTRPRPSSRSNMRALVGTLADDAWLPLLRMQIQIGMRDVQIAADHERLRRGRRLRPLHERLPRKSDLRGEVLAAVRHVDRRHPDVRHARRSDRATRSRTSGCTKPAAPARRAGSRKSRRPSSRRVRASGTSSLRARRAGRQLVGPRLDLLQADDVGVHRARSSRSPAGRARGCR